jgi:hypothetical protein
MKVLERFRCAVEAGGATWVRRVWRDDLRCVRAVPTADGEDVIAELKGPIVPPNHPRQVGERRAQLRFAPRAVIDPQLDLRDAACSGRSTTQNNRYRQPICMKGETAPEAK